MAFIGEQLKELIESGGGSGIIELPEQYVRITDLETGIYKLTYNGTKYVYYKGKTDTSSTFILSGILPYLLFVTKKQIDTSTTSAYWDWWTIYYNTIGAGYPAIRYGYTTSTSGQTTSKGLNYLLTSISSYVQNNLTYNANNSTYALSAYQGYLLDQRLQAVENSSGGSSGGGNFVPLITVATDPSTYLSAIRDAIQAQTGDATTLCFVQLTGYMTGNLIVQMRHYTGDNYNVKSVVLEKMSVIDNPWCDVSTTTISSYLSTPSVTGVVPINKSVWMDEGFIMPVQPQNYFKLKITPMECEEIDICGYVITLDTQGSYVIDFEGCKQNNGYDCTIQVTSAGNLNTTTPNVIATVKFLSYISEIYCSGEENRAYFNIGGFCL